MSNKIKANPLLGLIGTWQGDKGLDLAPKPEVDEFNRTDENVLVRLI